LVEQPKIWKQYVRFDTSNKMDLREIGYRVAWTGLVWLRIGTGGELL
jgi:hypothetical protein